MAQVIPADFIHELHGKISSMSNGYFYMSKKTGKMYFRSREEGYQKNQSPRQKWNSAAFAYAHKQLLAIEANAELTAQMEHLDEFVANKRATAEAYKEYFSHADGMEFFAEPDNCRSNYWLNAVLLPNREAQQDFLQYTNDHGIMTRPIWELMNRLPMFENCETDHLANTQMFADRVVNIPSSVRL